MKAHRFNAKIKLIGVNPYVSLPRKILLLIFKDAGKDKGYIPVCGTVNDKPFTQTLVRYSGQWRFYINTKILSNSPNRIGEQIEITISLDSRDRTIAPHPGLTTALEKNKKAKIAYENLSPSRQKEIVRYISQLKTEESITRNILRVIDFLQERGKFVGRHLSD